MRALLRIILHNSNGFRHQLFPTHERIGEPTVACGTVGRMDAAVELTGMYLPRVPQTTVGSLMPA